MSQPVRVSLVFPRSGQQVFVNVPRHIADYVDTQRSDHRPQHSDTYSPSAAHRKGHSENDPNSQ
jgi:hypothetical protein